jgi:uncharacterized protein YgiM (DUF1202 family)
VYTDPLTVRAGETLTVGRRDDEWPGWVWVTNEARKSGWMPEAFVEVLAEERGKVRRDYTARELELREGETVTVLDNESGWFWAQTADGRTGWAPASHLDLRESELTPQN